MQRICCRQIPVTRTAKVLRDDIVLRLLQNPYPSEAVSLREMRRSRTSCDEDGEGLPTPASPEKRRAGGCGFLSMLLITVTVFTLGVLLGSATVNTRYISFSIVKYHTSGEWCTG